MSIKTNEIQMLPSILKTDNLLADTSAAGTGRLTLEKLAQFLAEGDNAVSAALSNKADAVRPERIYLPIPEGWDSYGPNNLWYSKSQTGIVTVMSAYGGQMIIQEFRQ